MSAKLSFKDINILTQNVRGLKSLNKKHELLIQIKSQNLLAVCLQETWTKGYSIYEHDGCMLMTTGRDVKVKKGLVLLLVVKVYKPGKLLAVKFIRTLAPEFFLFVY